MFIIISFQLSLAAAAPRRRRQLLFLFILLLFWIRIRIHGLIVEGAEQLNSWRTEELMSYPESSEFPELWAAEENRSYSSSYSCCSWQLLVYCYGRAPPFVIPLIYSCLLLLSWLLALNLMILGKNSASNK